MTTSLARRVGRRAVAVALVGLVSAAAMFLGASANATPQAQQTSPHSTAEPTRIQCTVDLSTRPVKVQPGERVQLALNLAGIWVNIGAPQTVGDQPGEQLLSGVINGVLGLVGQVCSAVVQVESAVPLPDASVPELPLPEQTASVPVPGADVSLGTGASPSQPNPTPSQPVPDPDDSGAPDAGRPDGGRDRSGTSQGVEWRYGNTRVPLYDFSRLPYRVGYRFGERAAPAFRYGQQVPGYAPQFGILGAEPTEDVANAGAVRAMPVSDPVKVAFPVLVAVLMLSVVTGALVRTWVLRRA